MDMFTIGIDEVGRGPLAGPVAVCAFGFCVRQDLTQDFNIFIENAKTEHKLKLKDSKKLSAKQREKWLEVILDWQKQGVCDFAITYVSNENIDKFGIAPCIKKALAESLKKMLEQNKIQPTNCKVLLDGGLKAPDEYINQETFIKGDEDYPQISFASIVAKVSRDKIMADYAKKYPQYGLDTNMGYGSAAHMQALKTHGLTPIHRKTFTHL
ncbi:MAG: ribonuclease HII [Candidatus Pacebacteria bacterium]|nr:ribonuclease HII [Candidatus Paceibacterota bacterium]